MLLIYISIKISTIKKVESYPKLQNSSESSIEMVDQVAIKCGILPIAAINQLKNKSLFVMNPTMLLTI